MTIIETSGPGEGESFDHEAPPTHEAEQDKQVEATGLGSEKPAKAKKSKKSSKAKVEKPAGKAKKAKSSKPKAAKTKKAPKAKKASKPKSKATGGGRRGIRKDGKPRRAARTNPPKSEKAAALGRKIAKARKDKEWTQRQLAEKVGLSQPGVANIERGVAPPSEKKGTVAKIFKALGIKAA